MWMSTTQLSKRTPKPSRCPVNRDHARRPRDARQSRKSPEVLDAPARPAAKRWAEARTLEGSARSEKLRLPSGYLYFSPAPQTRLEISAKPIFQLLDKGHV